MERVERIDVPGVVAVRIPGKVRLDLFIRPATFRLVFRGTAPLNAGHNIAFHELDRGSGDSDGCNGEECRQEVSGEQRGC